MAEPTIADSSFGADGYRPPEPIKLPRPGLGRRAERLAQTAGVFGRRLAEAAVEAARGQPGGLPRAVRRAFEDLGATYVKFGQLVASAPAVLPPGLAEEFRTCLDSGPPIAFPRVRRIVEKELGATLEELFGRFDPEPFAAASVAVVHRAQLFDGREVAVKVIRPGVATMVAIDLDLMRPVAEMLARQGGERAYNGVAYLIGLREQIAEELDLRNEARSMEYFRRLFGQFELTRLVIPGVVASHSSRRVLTMDYLDGVAIDDLAAAERLGVDPRPLVDDLLRAWVLTALRAGVFHADIHAGNLLVLPEGRLAMLDWGIVARLEPRTRAFFRAMVEATLGDESAWERITEHVLRTQGPLLEAFGYSHEQIVGLVHLYLEPVLQRPLRDVSMASLFMSPEQAMEMNEGTARPRRGLRERWQVNRLTAHAHRVSLDEGIQSAVEQRANFLSAKQLLYLERYGRMYMPDQSLLGDHDFLRAALAMAPIA